MTRGRPKKVVEPTPEVPDDELLGGEVEKKEVKEDKPKVMVGYHPITGEEVWI